MQLAVRKRSPSSFRAGKSSQISLKGYPEGANSDYNPKVNCDLPRNRDHERVNKGPAADAGF
jgi:hypothetical protein